MRRSSLPVSCRRSCPDPDRRPSSHRSHRSRRLLGDDRIRPARHVTTPPHATPRESRSLTAIHVTGRADDLIGVASTASQGHIGSADLRLRPITREGELLETVPGIIVTQHSGEGKANQYFIRGFNLDHGTDFQTRLEGMPLNRRRTGTGRATRI